MKKILVGAAAFGCIKKSIWGRQKWKSRQTKLKSRIKVPFGSGESEIPVEEGVAHGKNPG